MTFRTTGITKLPGFLRMIMLAGALLICTLSYGQDDPEISDSVTYISGFIRDAKTLQPVAAAQIRALNREASATSGEEGTFTIGLTSANDVLLITAFDYNQREIPVRGTDNLEIDLFPDVFSGSYKDIELVTGTTRYSWLTGAARNIDNIGNTTAVSVDDVIQSRLGGDVRATSRSGTCGMGSALFIRGYNSLYRNAQPLFIVDGVIWNSLYDRFSIHDGYFTNSLADIDLNDIQDVTVIRDGTSIYGSKGGNGVIVINTKRANDLATKIVVNALAGVTEQPGSLPMMDADQFRIYTTDVLGSLELPTGFLDALGFLNDDPSETTYKKYHNITDWDDEVYRLGTSQSYNINANGGDDKALYAFSLGYTGNRGVVKTTDMQRLNMRFNGDFKMTNYLEMGLNLGFTNVDRILLDDGANYYTSPTYLAMIKAPFLSPYRYTVAGTLTTDVEDSDDFGISNPTAIIENALNTNKHYRLNLGVRPVIKITPSLSVSSHFDYSLDKLKETYFSPMIGVADRLIPGFGVSENVFKSLQMRNNAVYNDTRVHYLYNLNQIHRFNILVGWRYLYSSLESDYAEGHNSGTDQKRNLLGEEQFKKISGLNNETRSISNYANVDYSFDNRYFLTAAIAVDGSSRFGKETAGGFRLFGRSWGVFPSINVAWLVSSEKFMIPVNIIDRLKLRTGFGLSGNDDIEPYAWTPYLSSVKYMDRANGLIFGNIGNSSIQWETSLKYYFGVDANLFNDYLFLSADIYKNKTRDLLYLAKLPALAGDGYYWTNGGEMSNIGFELSAIVKVLNLEDIHWEFGANLGHYRNKILSIPVDNQITSIYGAEILTSTGNPAGVFYGFKTEGVFAGEADADAAHLKMVDPDGMEHTFGAGDVHFTDYFKDGIIDEQDRQVIGDPNPDLYGSFNSTIGFRNLALEAFFTYSYGNEVYNYLRRELESGKDFQNQTTAMLVRWISEGQQTDQPEAFYDDPVGNSRFSDRWIEDGSYLKLKSLSVRYKVPYKGRIIEGLTVWVSANNIWTLTNYLGRDPEFSLNNAVLYQGIDYGLIPFTRSYFIGVKMNL